MMESPALRYDEGFSYDVDHFLRSTDFELMKNGNYVVSPFYVKPPIWQDLGFTRHVVAFKVPKEKQIHDFYLRVGYKNIQL